MLDNKVPYDAGDEAAVGKRKTKLQLKHEKDIADLKAILSTKPGMSVLWRLLEFTAPFNGSFTGNSTTFFNEGRRAVGIELIRMIAEADPRAFAMMQLAAIDNKETE